MHHHHHARHHHFGFGSDAAAPPASPSPNFKSAASNLKDAASDLLPMGALGGVGFLIAKSLGATVLGAATAGVGGIALASWMAIKHRV